MLEHPDRDIRLIAIYALGQIGSDAQVAVPPLLKMIEDGTLGSQEVVPYEAARALKKIDPEAAAKAGVK